MKAATRSDLAHADEKRAYNRRLFRVVAPKYDFVTRALSFFRDTAWKRQLVDTLPAPNVRAGTAAPYALDIACGTGDLTELLAKRYPSASVVGLDLTDEMLLRARRRSSRRRSWRRSSRRRSSWRMPASPSAVKRQTRPAGSDGATSVAPITFVSASMDAIPYPAGTFTVVTGGYALRNAPNLDTTLQELYRVLRPGGTAAFLDFSRSPVPALWAIEFRLLRWWGGLWGVILHGDAAVYAYIARSLAMFPDRGELEKKLTDHGFTRVHSRLRMFGFLALTTFRKPPV